MNPEGRVTDTLPLFPLSQGLMPDGMLHLQIFEVRYLDLIKRCHAQQLPFGVAWLQKGSEVQVPGEVPSLHAYGCVAHIRQMDKVQANCSIELLLQHQHQPLKIFSSNHNLQMILHY